MSNNEALHQRRAGWYENVVDICLCGGVVLFLLGVGRSDVEREQLTRADPPKAVE